MSTISITNSVEFDDVVLKLNDSLNRIRDIFNEDGRTMADLLDDPRTWSGKAKNKTEEKYREFASYYPSITESLENFIVFLANTSESYKALEQSIDRSAEENASNLTVNS